MLRAGLRRKEEGARPHLFAAMNGRSPTGSEWTSREELLRENSCGGMGEPIYSRVPSACENAEGDLYK